MVSQCTACPQHVSHPSSWPHLLPETGYPHAAVRPCQPHCQGQEGTNTSRLCHHRARGLALLRGYVLACPCGALRQVEPRGLSRCASPAKGCSRTAKADLVAKGIIRRAPAAPPSPARHGQLRSPGSGRNLLPSNAIAELSRPGSAYVRVAFDPSRPGSAVSDRVGRPQGGYRSIGAGAGAGAGAGGVGAGSVDPIAHLGMPARSAAGGGVPRPGPVKPRGRSEPDVLSLSGLRL